jgi:hypothetical protein
MKKINLFLLIYKVILLLLVLAVLAWGLYCIFDYANAVKTDTDDLGTALGVAIVLIFSMIFDAALILLALPGLILSICRKTNPKRKREVVHFSLLTASPIVSFGIFYLVTLIVTQLV